MMIPVLVALGLVQAWGGRDMMNPDGIQYIEIGLNYLKGLVSRHQRARRPRQHLLKRKRPGGRRRFARCRPS
jgi:hypothetical protein